MNCSKGIAVIDVFVLFINYKAKFVIVTPSDSLSLHNCVFTALIIAGL